MTEADATEATAAGNSGLLISYYKAALPECGFFYERVNTTADFLRLDYWLPLFAADQRTGILVQIQRKHFEGIERIFQPF